MNSFERAKEATDIRTNAELARFLEVSPSTLQGYEKRETLPLEQCIKVAERTGVSLDWLIAGKGEMRPSAAVESGDVAFVPLFDVAVSAGGGAEVYGEEIVQYIPFDTLWLRREGLFVRHLACLSVTGDSMMPTFAPSDIVLVNHERKHGDGVFVIRLGNALRIKRLQWLADGSLRISSDNPIYQPEQIDPAKPDGEFEIIGACHTKIGRVF